MSSSQLKNFKLGYSLRATASIGSDVSVPSTSGKVSASLAVDTPGPQPTSSTRSVLGGIRLATNGRLTSRAYQASIGLDVSCAYASATAGSCQKFAWFMATQLS